MKQLTQFATINNLKVQPVRYRHQFGHCKRNGYDLLTQDNKILASFEPCEYSNGDKWYLRNVHEQYSGPRYITRITTKFLTENINVSANSFFINSAAK